MKPDSLIWECPLCGAKVEMPREGPKYWTERLVDEHKHEHQRYGLKLV